MMMTNRTDMRRYIDESTLQYSKKHKFSIELLKNKPAFTSISTVRYYTDEVIEVTLEEKDKEELLKKMTWGNITYGISLRDIVKAIFGPNAEDEYAYVDCNWTIVWEVGKKGFGYTRYSRGSKVHTPTYTFWMAKLSSLKEVPLTKRDEEKKQMFIEKESRRRLNAITIKDTMTQILNEKEYDVYSSDRGISFGGIKGYNKLMKDALEFYLNNIIFKDMNLVVTTPKVKNQHKYGYNDYLLNFGDIEIKEQ